jgi:hypothetical protein
VELQSLNGISLALTLEKADQIVNIGKPDSKSGRGRSGEKYVAREFHQAAGAGSVKPVEPPPPA